MKGGYHHLPELEDEFNKEEQRNMPQAEEMKVERYRSSWRRWWILFVFSFVSFNQSLVWFTFSSVPTVVKAYFPGVGAGDIDLLLNWGSIIFIPVLPYVVWLQTRPNGLILAFWQANLLVFSATLIRTIPCWAPDHLRGNFYMQWLLHIGQILNAGAGPIAMALCSKLSAVWFPDHQRATATAPAYTANAFGTSLGFMLGPAIARSTGDLPTLLYFEMGLAVVPVIGGLVYFRERPSCPPSAVALAHIEGRYESNLLKGMKDSLPNIPFWLAIIAGGLQGGVASGWQGVLPQSLENLHYSESEAGWLGFAGSVAGIVGGVAIGPVIDAFFQRKCKLLLLILFGGAVLTYGWLTLSLPTPFFDTLLPSNYPVLVSALVVSGLCQGAVTPVIYELSAELLYPSSEDVSGGLLMLWMNIVTLVVLFISPVIATNWMNTIMTATMLVCFVLVVFIVERYRRWEAEVAIYREGALHVQGE